MTMIVRTMLNALYNSSVNKQTKTNKRHRPLTRKQKAFVQHLVDNPKASATQAAMVAYGKPGKELTNGTARAIASENLTKPSILAVLNDACEEAEDTILSVMRVAQHNALTDDTRDGAAWAAVARGTANDVLDRVHGKATTKIEATQAVVTINMDLSSTIDSEGA